MAGETTSGNDILIGGSGSDTSDDGVRTFCEFRGSERGAVDGASATDKGAE